MRPRLITAVAAGALAVSLLGPTGPATADPEVVPGPAVPETTATSGAESPAEVLDEAQAVLAPKSPLAARRAVEQGARPDATMALNRLMRVYGELSPADQRAAERLFARPTDPGGDTVGGGTFAYDEAPGSPACGDVVCVHWAEASDSDAPPPADTNPANGIPDAVDESLAVAEQVNATYEGAGYLRPEGDGAAGGGEDLVDVYLADTGAAGGLYGYCTADEPLDEPPYHRPAYCVIDEDFRNGQFPINTPSENRQVTLAHEYFHAVQYAYDAFEDPWIIEATATWAEDELFDDVDDNRQYLAAGQLRRPWIPLDWFGFQDSGNHYGNWIYFRYLTERLPARAGGMPTLVRDVWRRLDARAGRPNQYSTQALQSVLAARGTSFTATYGQFADAIRRPKKAFSEGGAAAYRPSPTLKTWTLSAAKRNTGTFSYDDAAHLTSFPLRYKPAKGLKQRNWKLRIKVDLPPANTAPVARVSVYLKNGKVSSSPVKFKANGFSKKVVGFSARKVKYVELVVANASRRMTDCGEGTVLACGGYPRDDFKRVTFGASIFRP